jgi:hypothetical protein
MNPLLRKFIRETLLEAGLTGKQLDKLNHPDGVKRFSEFLHRIRKGIHFQTTDGKIIQIHNTPRNRHLVAALRAESWGDYNRAFKSGVEIEVLHDPADPTGGLGFDIIKSGAKILKDPGFGSSDPFVAEKIQVSNLQVFLDTHGPIPIYLGPTLGIETIDGLKYFGEETQDGVALKEDIALLSGGSQVALVSLKSADTPAEMMQWGGISDLLALNIRDTTDFKGDADLYLSQNGPGSIAREIGDPNIAKTAVYGLSSKVDIIAASKSLTFSPSSDHGGAYLFTGQVFYKPQIPSGVWEPVYLTFPSSGRGGGQRWGIYPRGFASSKGATFI